MGRTLTRDVLMIYGGVVLVLAVIGLLIAASIYVRDREDGRRAERVRLHDGWDLVGIQLDGAIRVGCVDPAGRVRERCIRYRDETAFPETVPCRSALWLPNPHGWPVTTRCR